MRSIKKYDNAYVERTCMRLRRALHRATFIVISKRGVVPQDEAGASTVADACIRVLIHAEKLGWIR